jgi:zinc protease
MKTALRPCWLAPVALAACMTRVFAEASAPVWPKEVTSAEGIHEYRLSNGLQILLVPEPSKRTVTVNVTYRVGSRFENYGETGMAHLLEHLLFKSTARIPDVGAELSRRGMVFNGGTTKDQTSYHESFPMDIAQLKWALTMEADRMTGARVLQKELDSEMTVVRNEMENGENNPLGILMERTVAAAYQWHSYGRDTIGARSDVENVQIAHLQAFYRKFYQPDNATLIVAGAFDEAEVLREIAVAFGGIPRPKRVLDRTYTLEPVQEGEREVTLRRAGGVQALAAFYHVPAGASADAAALAVISTLLDDEANGRLHRRLVDSGKAVEASAGVSDGVEPGLFRVTAILKSDDSIDEAQTILLNTAEGFATDPVTEEELHRVQQEAGAAFDMVFADPDALCDLLSEASGEGDWRLALVLRERIKNLTVEEVNRVARTWLKSSNRTLGRFIPTNDPDRAPLAGRVSAEEAMKDFHPAAALEPGEVFDPTPENLDTRTHRFTLPSGLKVALFPKKTRGQTVTLELGLHFGSQASLEGLRETGDMVAALVGRGTRTKSRAQIQDAFDALKTAWSVGGSVAGASASLTTTRANLKPALTLLTEVLREATFSASEFDQVVRADLTGLEADKSNPQAIANTALTRALQPYGPQDVRYYTDISEQSQSIQTLKREDVEAFYRDFWGANHGELAIVGDFDEAEMRQAIPQLLGDWVSKRPYERLSYPASSVAGLHLQAQVPDKASAVVLGELPLRIQVTDVDYPALRVATSIMGGDGFDSRLIKRLRVADGLSYGAGAALSASRFEPSGTLSLFATFAPQNLKRVRQGFDEELARLVKDGVQPDELAAAKKAILSAHQAGRASDAAVAGVWVNYLHENQTYSYLSVLDRQIDSLSVQQVNAAMRKWIDPKRINWSEAGDFKSENPKVAEAAADRAPAGGRTIASGGGE